MLNGMPRKSSSFLTSKQNRRRRQALRPATRTPGKSRRRKLMPVIRAKNDSAKAKKVNADDINISGKKVRTKGGTSAAYVIGTLKGDNPALAQEVIDGKVSAA